MAGQEQEPQEAPRSRDEGAASPPLFVLPALACTLLYAAVAAYTHCFPLGNDLFGLAWMAASPKLFTLSMMNLDYPLGYPVLLRLGMLMGLSPYTWAVALNVVASGVNVWLVALLAKRLFAEARTAAFAALVYGLATVAVVSAVNGLVDALMTTFVLGAMVLALRSSALRSALVAGALMGIGFWLRRYVLVFLPLPLAALWLGDGGRSRAWPAALALTAAMLVLMGPDLVLQHKAGDLFIVGEKSELPLGIDSADFRDYQRTEPVVSSVVSKPRRTLALVSEGLRAMLTQRVFVLTLLAWCVLAGVGRLLGDGKQVAAGPLALAGLGAVWMVPLRVLRTADVWRGMLPSLACAYVLMVGAIIVAWRLTLRGPSWQRAVSTLAALALMVSLLSFPARHTQLLAAARHLAADTARLHAEALAAGATRADQVATNSFELMFSPAPEPGDPVRLYRRVDTPGWFTNTPAFREDFGWHVPTSYEDLHTWARSQGIKVIYLDSPPRQIRAPFEPSAVPSALFETRWFNEGTSMLLRVE